METRLIVEPELAARAAERATSDALAALRRSIEGMKNERHEHKPIELDLAFHDAIFQASGNVLCQALQPDSPRHPAQHPAHVATGGRGPYLVVSPPHLRCHRPPQCRRGAQSHDRAPARRPRPAAAGVGGASPAGRTGRPDPAGDEAGPARGTTKRQP
jgi:hypothetical protein